MHLSRGHTNSNIISSLPFTESAWFEKRYTPFLPHSTLIIHFQGELAGFWKRKCHCGWSLREVPTWSGFVRRSWGALRSFESRNNTLEVTGVSSFSGLKKRDLNRKLERPEVVLFTTGHFYVQYMEMNSVQSQQSSTTTSATSPQQRKHKRNF